MIANTIARFPQQSDQHRCNITITHIPQREEFIFKAFVTTRYSDRHNSGEQPYSSLVITVHRRNHYRILEQYLLLFNIDTRILVRSDDSPIMNLDIALVRDNYSTENNIQDPVVYEDVLFFVECKGGRPENVGRRRISTEDIAAFIGQVYLLSNSVESTIGVFLKCTESRCIPRGFGSFIHLSATHDIAALYVTLKGLTASPRKILQILQERVPQSLYINYIEALNPLANSRTNDRQLRRIS